MAEATRWRADSEYGVLRDVLLCPADNFRWLPTSSISRATLASGAVFDGELARRQHAEMAAAYAAALRFYEESGTPPWRMVTAGSFEGGDFHLVEPGFAVIGYSGERTQEQSARQVAGWLEEEGWEVLLEPIAEHYVHIDVMLAMLAPKLAAVCPETASERLLAKLRERKIELLPVGYRDAMALGCNAASLGADRILSSAHSQDLNGKLRALGFTVYDPDLSMFTLGGGGAHCLCQALLRDPA